MIYDYIIVGAGISGLSLNKLLGNKKTLILESNDRVGGRIFNLKIGSNAELGAKFLNSHFDFLTDLYPGITTEKEIKSLKKSKKVKMFSKCKPYEKSKMLKKDIYNNIRKGQFSNKRALSLFTEDIGSANLDKIHPEHKFYPYQKNIRYNFTNLLNKLTLNAAIKFNSVFTEYTIHKDYISVKTSGNEYKTRKLVFALPITILRRLKGIPFKSYLNYWFQNKVTVTAIEFRKLNNKLQKDFFYCNEFNKTSFYHDYQCRTLYVARYETSENETQIRNLIDYIIKYLELSNIAGIEHADWTNNRHSLGGWTIPGPKVSQEIIEKMRNGYKDKIFFVGDYMNNIDNCGEVSSAIKSSILLSKLLNKK